MTETIKDLKDERLVDANIKTTGGLHPSNRKGERILNNSNKFSERSLDSFNKLSEKRIRKKCVACLNTFSCSLSKNYDYCSSCEINESRYLNKDSPCSECDGSGLVKFPNQPFRSCKLCYLTKGEILAK